VREEKTINTEEEPVKGGEGDGRIEFTTTTNGEGGALKTHTSQKEQPIGIAEEINEINLDNRNATVIQSTNSSTLLNVNDNGGMCNI
jgi:hypothetical protein